MGRYDDIKQLLRNSTLKNDLTPVSRKVLRSVEKEFPEIPEDYMDFLREVGGGTYGDDSFVIYEGPISADEIYDEETARELSHIVFFGDNMGGDCAGFDTRNKWKVVEVESIHKDVSVESPTFEKYIRERIRDRYED